jgi:hypothetical protein
VIWLYLSVDLTDFTLALRVRAGKAARSGLTRKGEATMADTIKKLEVKETVLFAINHIPQVDKATLEKFLELMNATGTFGTITYEQIFRKMVLTLKYIPDASPQSLLILADLLEIPKQVARPDLFLPETEPARLMPLYEKMVPERQEVSDNYK